MNDSTSHAVLLKDNVSIPIMGFGTFELNPGDKTETSVIHALESGFRRIDTAQAYENEADVGRAIKSYGLEREDVFITTKLWITNYEELLAVKSIYDSLRRLDFEYVDLFLMHWPVPESRNRIWELLLLMKDQGACRSVGVSNYSVKHLQEILSLGLEMPSVNQIECSPFLQQKEVRGFCSTHGVQVDAYSPLTQGRMLNHPALSRISAKYGKTNAQIILRWLVNQGLLVTVGSRNRIHMDENIAMFDVALEDEDYAILAQLDSRLRVCWNPENVP